MSKVIQTLSEPRLQRALTERQALLWSNRQEGSAVWQIYGQTDDYTVEANAQAKSFTCTCPDFSQRGATCKHMFFVLVRVLGVEPDILRTLEWEGLAALLSVYQPSEAKEDKEEQGQKCKPGVQERAWIGQDCPICMCPMEEGESRVICTEQCGNSVHAGCFKKWSSRKGSKCVLCRAPIPVKVKGKGKRRREEYESNEDEEWLPEPEQDQERPRPRQRQRV